MNIDNFHLIKSKNINIIYHCSTSSIISLSDIPFHVLELLKKGTPIDNIVTEYEPYRESIYLFIKSLSGLDENEEYNQIEENNKRKINRITLHVSNDCNLRCKYCYAGGGNYNQSRKLMSLNVAKEFVEFCECNFDEVENIVFFGGEPMLNLDVMEFICNQFKKDYKEGKCNFMPLFKIITNGTLLNKRIVQFLQEYISVLTVSIDGDQHINDLNRVFADGKGSYAKIAQFIHTVREETSVNMAFEATFNQSHIDLGYKITDVYNNLEKEFGIRGFVIQEEGLDPEYSVNYLKTIDYDDLSNIKFDDFPYEFWVILKSIVQKVKYRFCPIVNDIFAVSTDGNIYPCHAQNGMNNVLLGNINGINVFNEPLLYSSFISKLTMKNNKKCKNCWAKNLCGGCTYKRFYDRDKKEYLEEPIESFCKSTKRFVEQVIIAIASIRKNTQTWNAFLEEEKKHRHF